MPQSTGNPPSNIYRIPRRFNWTFVIGGFALVTFVLMAWRLGSAAFDSHAYLDTARWLRGDLPQSALEAPFSYRLAVPALAALLPGQVSHVFGVLNWLFVAATACLATAAVRRMGFGTQRALAAGMLAMLSLPVVWYAPTALVEPGSICMRMLFVFAVLTVKPRLALAAALAATAISEDNILLLGWLVATQRSAAGPVPSRSSRRSHGWASCAGGSRPACPARAGCPTSPPSPSASATGRDGCPCSAAPASSCRWRWRACAARRRASPS